MWFRRTFTDRKSNFSNKNIHSSTLYFKFIMISCGDLIEFMAVFDESNSQLLKCMQLKHHLTCVILRETLYKTNVFCIWNRILCHPVIPNTYISSILESIQYHGLMMIEWKKMLKSPIVVSEILLQSNLMLSDPEIS